MFSLRNLPATSVLILSAAAVPLVAQRTAPAQRGGAPRADTPQLLVSVLASHDAGVGIAAAEAIRSRMQSEHVATDLYVVPRAAVERTLRASGYNPDSVLGADDISQLARQVRANYALAGTIERTASGVRTSVRLLTQTGSHIVAEPLPPIDGANLGDIAKQVDHAVSEAIRALGFYHECTNALRLPDYTRAMAAAQQGLKLRPASASLNLCVLSILSVTKASPDSIIAVASAITAVDSESTIAWANLVDAYDHKADSARAIDAMRTIHRLDPRNVAMTVRLVDRFIAAGQPDSAIALLDIALHDAATNADLLRKKWLLDLRLGQYAAALKEGAAMIEADSTAATPDYYERQLAAAKGAHDTTSAHQIAAMASTRFPQNATFLLTLARDTLDRGATREALGLVQRVLSIEPASQLAWQLAIAAHARSNGIDSALATARKALAARVSPDAVGSSLNAVIAAMVGTARSSEKPGDWEAVFRAAQSADSIASSPAINFYLGVAAFQIASDEAQSLAPFTKKQSPTRAERETACSSSKRVEDLVSVVNIAIQRGGKTNPAVATQIMGALPGYADFASSVKRASCR